MFEPKHLEKMSKVIVANQYQQKLDSIRKETLMSNNEIEEITYDNI